MMYAIDKLTVINNSHHYAAHITVNQYFTDISDTKRHQAVIEEV